VNTKEIVQHSRHLFGPAPEKLVALTITAYFCPKPSDMLLIHGTWHGCHRIWAKGMRHSDHFTLHGPNRDHLGVVCRDKEGEYAKAVLEALAREHAYV
jgi:hypothetical protein